MLTPIAPDSQAAWPHWARHEAMEDDFDNLLKSYQPPDHPPSLVILRRRKETEEALEEKKRLQKLEEAKAEAKAAEDARHAPLAISRAISGGDAPPTAPPAADQPPRPPVHALIDEGELDEEEKLWAPMLPDEKDAGAEEDDDHSLSAQLPKPPPDENIAVIATRLDKLERAMQVAAAHQRWIHRDLP